MKVKRKVDGLTRAGVVTMGDPFEHRGYLYVKVNLGIHHLKMDPLTAWGVRLSDGLLTCFGEDDEVRALRGEFTEL